MLNKILRMIVILRMNKRTMKIFNKLLIQGKKDFKFFGMSFQEDLFKTVFQKSQRKNKNLGLHSILN